MALSINISDNNDAKKSQRSSVSSTYISTKRVSSTGTSQNSSYTTSRVISPDPARNGGGNGTSTSTTRLSSSSEDPFKKKSKKRSKFKSFLLVFLVLIIGIGAYGGYRVKSFTDEIGIKLQPKDIILPIKKDPELKKDSAGKLTNVMLVGIDTRETDPGLQNTDTIIVASYNHENNEAVMISIPRDTYVEIPGTTSYVKINGIYNYAERDEEGKGLEGLQGVVEEYTGLEIQYYAMVDVVGLTEIIDIIGGIDIVVENSFTDYAYPAENGTNGYQTVSFKAGPQTMDGETAVKYARSRKSLDNGEGTDFARAKRQQKVINAIKEKALSSETLLNPEKLLNIMVQVQENIKVSEFSNEDIQASLKLLEKKGNLQPYSFVLDPTSGAGELIQTGGIEGAYALTPVAGIGNYEDINLYIQLILENPALYEEKARIYTYDAGLGYYPAFEATKALVAKYPFLNILYQGTLYTGKQGTFVYDNTLDSSKPVTVKSLSEGLEGSTNIKPEFVTTRLNGEDVVIIFGAPIPEPVVEEVTPPAQ